ncbi:SCY1-like protein 2 isoform X3 [Mercenaria mercenaria]|uniref:SCY1-like protein 2 isoform X3 n=1 Tax=Mercenaria mercenaria TaxID=6596 RepID=UPI00234E991F|nr:SCY1-like protein 2 isoform X3 [Mercenaria mercenaria]
MSYPPVYESSYFITEQDRGGYQSSKPCGSCRLLCCASSLAKTMDVFSMIKHSIISDEVNPITRYFDIRQHVASCGPEMVWKIFDAIRLEDSKEVSVFFFEKKIADKLHKPRRREIVSEILRREVQLLLKMKHPKILTVIHPLEECHNSLAFATEPVVASLANFLGNYERMPVPVPSHIKDREFLELEIKYGILQITEGLSYLHGTEQIIHRNVCPQSVLVTKTGSWKLAGLGFAEMVVNGKEKISCQPWSTKASKLAQPNLNYIAPEVQTDKKCSMISDIFSLGITVCCIYNNGQPLISAEHNPQTYLKQLEQLTQQFGDVAHKMPLPLVEPVEKMINKDTRYRPTAQLFSLLKYFHDPVVSCLQRLDNLEQLETSQQRAEVYTNLIQVIPDIHKKVLYGHVLPNLVESCLSIDTMFMALPAMLALIDHVSKADYANVILPHFRTILNYPRPMQATVYLLDKLDIILAKSPIDVIKTEMIPLVFNTLDSNSIQAQEAALGCIRLIKEYLDDNIMKSMVLPRAKSLYNKSDNMKMRINALTCIDTVLDSLDKMIILDEVLPFLMDITLGQDAKIVMAVVGIYKHLMSDKKFGLTHNLIATKVMPPLIPQTVNPGLSMEQFSALMEVLRDMLEHIDRKRRDKMKQETVTVPIPHRGLINMSADSQKDSTRNFLSVDDAVHLQKSRTEYSFSSLPILESNKTSSIEHQPVKITIRKVPATPESHPKLSAPKPKSITHNASGGSLDEQTLSPPHPTEIQRRHSLAPPQTSSTPPIISLTSEDTTDKKRRSSAQSLGPFSFSDSDSRRGSRGSVFGSLGISDGPAPQRRASFQALGESMMQLFSGK